MNPSAPDLQDLAGDAWRLFWRDELTWLLADAVLVALVLWRVLREGRRALRNTMLFLVLCLAAEPVGAVLETAGAARSGTLVRGAAIVATGLALIRLGGLALFRGSLPAAGFAVPRIVEEVVLLLAYVAWCMLRLRLAGMDLASLVTTSAVITAVAAFAMQDTLGNVLGGLFLELDRSLAVGDWIRVDDLSGRVADIHWRHTTIRTRNGELVIVPNAALMKSRFMVIGNPRIAGKAWTLPAAGAPGRMMLRMGTHEVAMDETHPSVTIGRADQSDFVLKGDLISRLHRASITATTASRSPTRAPTAPG